MKCNVLNRLGNATSDLTAFKIPQVSSSILAVLGLYSRSLGIFNAVESSIALSNCYLATNADNLIVVIQIKLGYLNLSLKLLHCKSINHSILY